VEDLKRYSARLHELRHNETLPKVMHFTLQIPFPRSLLVVPNLRTKPSSIYDINCRSC